MNLNGEFHKKGIVVKALFGGLISLLTAFFLVDYLFTNSPGNNVPASKEQPKVLGISVGNAGAGDSPLRKADYEEFSPDQKQKITRYQVKYDENLFGDYHGYLDSMVFISLTNVDEGREKYIFVGEEKTGDPHWLNNEYIFFTSYCGTSCQGLYLVDVGNKESELAVISYVFNGDGPWITHFRDWFGGEFVFKGLVGDIASLTVGDKSYLIFEMKDENKNPLGEERLLFMGKSLKKL